MSKLQQVAYTSLAGISFGLGVIGLFLPLMPTTCFMLLAVWLASRGSPRFAMWIRQHPRFGPSLTAWERERAIPRHAKLLAVIMLGLTITLIAWSVGSLALRGGLIGGLVLLALWIATRPDPQGSALPLTQRLPTQRLSNHRLGRWL